MKSRTAPAPEQQQISSTSFLPALLAWCFIFLLAALAIFELKPPAALPATASQDQFSAERALTHVRAIANVPHPIGSKADAAAREYLVSQLSSLGMNPQVSQGIGIYSRSGVLVAGRTNDILGRLPGSANSKAILLLAHYDSVPSGPGAADDASSVAAILEAVRALRTGPALKNDLIVLFTDGEEPGLLGAEAFVASHPALDDIGLVLNFEARGNRGPSLLFETSADNASLMNEVSKAAPYPVGSSLFYALYKLLPNDTDFTRFRPSRIPGLNFAFGGDLQAYHSSLDTPDNLDTASLQHQGFYVLPLVRHFGQMDLNQLRQQAGDNVFFDWFGSSLIAYGQRWVVIGEIVATLLLVFVIVSSARRGQMRAGRLVTATLASLLLLFTVPVAMAAVGWLLLQLISGRMLVGDAPANAFLLVGLAMLGAAGGCAVLARLRRRFTPHELSLAGLVIVCILSWALALLLPAGSYLLFWPLLFALIGFGVLAVLKAGSPHTLVAGNLLAALVTILLFAPFAYLIYVFLTLNVISIAVVGLLLGMFFLLCGPFMSVAIPQRPGRALLLPLLLGAAVCTAVGITQSHSSPQHPRPDRLLYSLNADDHTALWISDDPALDAYTAQFFSGKTPNHQPIPDYLGGSQRSPLSGPAPAVDLQAPVTDVQADEKEGDLHHLRMNVKSQREADLIVVRFDPSVKPVSVKVAGRTMSPQSGPAGLFMLLYGMGAQGADLDLRVKAASGISFWVSDYSMGLPTTIQRAPNFIAAQGSDQTLVCRKYTLK